MKHLMITAALSIAAHGLPVHAVAGCPDNAMASLYSAPAVPDGNSASRREMYDAGRAMQQYILEVEDYLGCAPQELTLVHNQMVQRITAAADDYNQQLRVFQARERNVASFINTN